MVPVKHSLSLALLCVACGGPEFDALTRADTNDAIVFTCPSGEVVSFPIVRETGMPQTIPDLAESEGCLGVGAMCPDGTPSPGDAMCDDANVNRFRGTCVESFFSCYQPSGTCTDVDTNGSQSWSSGDRFALDIGGQFIPAGADTSCILVEYDFGNGESRIYLRER
jgi:hypothetical protein